MVSFFPMVNVALWLRHTSFYISLWCRCKNQSLGTQH